MLNPPLVVYVWVSLLIRGSIGANDLRPVFEVSVADVSLPEDLNVGTTVIDSVVVRDGDDDNPALRVTCVSQSQQYDPCDFFELVATSPAPTANLWTGQILLKQSLDFETVRRFELVIEASDIDHQERQNFEIQVQNRPDQPPTFISAMTAEIPENYPIDQSIIQVTAVDGDEGLNRVIAYSLVNDRGYFNIDGRSGVITSRRFVDRESAIFSAGSTTLQVRAQELQSDGQPDPSPLAQSVGEVTITITDVNDNGPVFSPGQLTIGVDEAIPLGATLAGFNMRVADYDQGANAVFDLTLLDHTDTFALSPSRGSNVVALSITVKDKTNFDYEVGPRNFLLRISAKEVGTAESRESQGLVYIDLQDDNDNPPVFAEPSYQATVSELATDGTYVTTITATDADSSNYGVEGLRYKLTGDGSNYFKVNRYNGVITVDTPSICWNFGVTPCLDAETQSRYELTLVATDNYAEGLQASVPLTIDLIDANDNSPIIEDPEYVTSIREGSTVLDHPVTVQATDRDVPTSGNNVLTYRIIAGNPGDLFNIDPQTGVFTPRLPIPYPDDGFYLLTVEVSDPDFTATTTVRVDVTDINNHPPEFSQGGFYEQTIPETTAPGSVVETVTAFDGDSQNTPNGMIQYRIVSGGRGKFVLDQTTGVVRVAPGATFDYETQNQYIIYLVAEDQGDPQLSSNATLIVNILDTNNKNPYLRPSTVRSDVYENVIPGTVVTTMQAFDPDSGAVLRYSFQEPIKAWDPQNAEIPNNPHKDWFAIDDVTGVITVNSQLDRDEVIRWSAVVQVEDTNAPGDQTATGSVLITILDVNEQGPVFGPPWSPSNPNIDINVREGQGQGAYVTVLAANDPSDDIDRYILLSNPGGYFDLNEDTGVVTIARPLDYEQTSFTQFVVVAVDDGQPPLSATATFNVNIININDETPTFTQRQYETSIFENSPAGFQVIRVEARDLDSGDYGVVRYEIEQPEDRFVIDPITGWITVAEGADLDRETSRLINIGVKAYDSPQNATLRKFSPVTRVQILLLDVDEFSPRFGEGSYTAAVPENSPPGTSVIELTASDQDDAPTVFVYQKLGGDPKNLFFVDPGTGVITTRTDLDGEPGTYNVSVLVSNGGRTDTAFVSITVFAIDNNPPVWDYPNESNQTVSLPENQPPGIPVTQVFAHDDDQGINGELDYGFDVNGDMVNATEEFSINPVTGRITALVSFDRETKESYLLQLLVRDRGRPYQEARQPLVINIEDLEDNNPEFPTYANCCTIPATIDLIETTAVDSTVGRVVAVDEDTGERGVIIYSIEEGNEGGTFTIDPATGTVSLNNTLDHERVSSYQLLIKATNPTPGPPSVPGPQCNPNCTDPSIMVLHVNVIDVNEMPPVFSNQVFNACISVNAPIGKAVTRIQATDPDKQSSVGVTYSLNGIRLSDNSVNVDNSFWISEGNGTVYSATLMDLYLEKYFRMGVQARDANYSTTASLRIWVTPPSKEVKVTINAEKDVVERDLDTYVQQISELTGFGIVCVNSIRYHTVIGGGGDTTVDITRTDLFIHVIDPETLVIWDEDYVSGRLAGFEGQPVLGAATQWTGFIRDPVMIAIIIVAILLFIALLLLCCLCWCWSAFFKKTKYVEAPKIINAGVVNPYWKGLEEQELSMAVLDGDTKLKATSGYANAGFDHTDTTYKESKISNGYVATHEEVTLEETTHVGSSGLPVIEADLSGGSAAAASSTMLLTSGSALGGSILSTDTMNRGIQTDELAGTLNTSMELPPHHAPIGATLSRTDVRYESTSGSMDLTDDYVGTTDGRTVNTQAYSSTTHLDLRGPPADDPRFNLQISPQSEVEYPDGFYQGEIHLGSMPHSHSPSYAHPVAPVPAPVSPPAPTGYQYQETQFSETRQYHSNTANYGDGDIEYITF